MTVVSDCYFENKMLIYFTDSLDKTKKEKIDIKEYCKTLSRIIS